MSYAADIAKCKNPQEALLLVAQGIDQILAVLQTVQPQPDPWAWQEASLAIDDALVNDTAILDGLYDQLDDKSPVITETEDTTDIFIMPVTDAKKDQRREFERNYLKLAECLGKDADPTVDYNEVYAKGGPLWLYHGNRGLFMSYDYPTRAAMCQDVIEESPKAGHEMAIDALKQPGETGPGGVGMATDTVAPGARIYTRD